MPDVSNRKLATARHVRSAAMAAATLALFASPALAQEERPVADPVSQLRAGLELCLTTIDIDELDATRDALTASGWTVADETTYGPAIHTLSATRENGRFYTEVTSYPSVFLSYCSFEVVAIGGAGDMEGVAAEYGLEGPIAMESGNAYGTWEMQLDGGVAVFTALAEADHFLLQMNWIEQAGTGG